MMRDFGLFFLDTSYFVTGKTIDKREVHCLGNGF